MIEQTSVLLRPARPLGWGYLWAIAVVALTTVVNAGLQTGLGIERSSNGIYWLAIVWCAVSLDRGPAIWGAVLSGFVVDYFFIPPLYTPNVGAAELLRTAIMVGVAIYVGECSRAVRISARRPRVWADVTPTDDHEADIEVGQKIAEVFVAQRAVDRKLYLLGWKVKEIVKTGRFEGAEVGFFRGISAALLGSLDNADHAHGRHGRVETQRDVAASAIGTEQSGSEELPERESAINAHE